MRIENRAILTGSCVAWVVLITTKQAYSTNCDHTATPTAGPIVHCLCKLPPLAYYRLYCHVWTKKFNLSNLIFKRKLSGCPTLIRVLTEYN